MISANNPGAASAPQAMPESPTVRPRVPWRIRIGLALAGLAVLVLIGGVGALAVRQGMQDRTVYMQQRAEEFYQKGLEREAAGDVELAAAYYEQALRIAPDHVAARDHLAVVGATVTAVSTPTSKALSSALDLLFAQGEQELSQGKLQQAAATFEHLVDVDPTFRSDDVEDKLFGIYTRQAEDLTTEQRFEEAIRADDRALRLRPDAQEVAVRRELLALYVSGLGAFGADWSKAITDLEAAYRISPGFLDVEARLLEARIAGGDALMGDGDWCGALALYENAGKLESSSIVQAKLNDASERCRLAVAPTVAPMTTATPGGTPQPTTRLPFGRLAYAQYDPARATYDVAILAADGTRKTIVQKAGEPDLSPDGARIAFRSLDRTDPGIHIVDADGSQRARVTRSASHLQPRWSPDGKQLVFISDEDRPTAAVMIVPADGSAGPTELAKGWAAAWSPRNTIALTGCGADGEQCGIQVTQDGSGPLVRLTGDRNDISPQWMPDGSAITYMSNHDGNWEIYTLRPAGSLVRRCTVNPAEDVMPTWAPNGSAILFESNRDGSWGLYLMEPDGSNQRKVLDIGADHPSWLREQLSWAR